MSYIVFDILQRILQVFYWLIIIRAILSFIQPRTYNKLFADFRHIVYTVTEPVLGPIRRLVLPYTPGLDISPLIAILIIGLLRRWLFAWYWGLF